ncbi:MAG: hypothetical protein NUV67_01810 [archaeon]|nr:hypothetical protein [archaeon]
MKRMQNLSRILGQQNNLFKFSAFSVLAGIILALTSGAIILPIMIINPLADPLKVLAMAIIAILIGLNLTVLLSFRKMAATTAAGFGFGSAAATVTTACAFCPPLVFAWFGAGTTAALFTDFSIYIGVISIGLLLAGLYYSLDSNECNNEKGEE